jgi:hypothetical protein
MNIAIPPLPLVLFFFGKRGLTPLYLQHFVKKDSPDFFLRGQRMRFLWPSGGQIALKTLEMRRRQRALGLFVFQNLLKLLRTLKIESTRADDLSASAEKWINRKVNKSNNNEKNNQPGAFQYGNTEPD